MTSKRELRRAMTASQKSSSSNFDQWAKELLAHARTQNELAASKKANAAAAESLVEGFQRQTKSLVGLLDDILVIEPQLKHLLTGGVWDFERVHRAAEHLRGEDALESVGYTSDCVEIDMSNVIPFPTDPDSTYRGAA